MKKILIVCGLLLSGLMWSSGSLIYKINLQKEIGPATWLYVREGFKEAQQLDAAAVLIHMNTYGGEVLYADSIRTKILNSEKPVWVFVDNNAASAGALISIACDKIYMRKGANIGAATVVNGVDGKAMPDKYQSYMRATIRATAEAQGQDTLVSSIGDTSFVWKRDPLMAEAMVDERVFIKNVSDSGKILTFTALEAQKNGYCDGLAETVEEVIESELHSTEYVIKEYKPTVKDQLKGFLMSSVLQSILVMIMIGGIYYELQTPGIGFPLAAAITAAVIYFAPLYIDGLATNWEILLFVIGILLLAAEIFVIPGFGIAGISGFFCMISGLVLSLLDNDFFQFKHVQSEDAARALLTVLVGLLSGFALMIYLTNKIGHGIFRKLALEATQEVQDGYLSVDVKGFELVGKEGLAGTMLRPSGRVIIDSISYDAISLVGYIEKDTAIKVIRYESGQLYVQKKM